MIDYIKIRRDRQVNLHVALLLRANTLMCWICTLSCCCVRLYQSARADSVSSKGCLTDTLTAARGPPSLGAPRQDVSSQFKELCVIPVELRGELCEWKSSLESVRLEPDHVHQYRAKCLLIVMRVFHSTISEAHVSVCIVNRFVAKIVSGGVLTTVQTLTRPVHVY